MSARCSAMVTDANCAESAHLRDDRFCDLDGLAVDDLALWRRLDRSARWCQTIASPESGARLNRDRTVTPVGTVSKKAGFVRRLSDCPLP